MSSDPLDRPLGTDLDRDRGPGRDIPWRAVGLAGVAAIAAGLYFFVRMTDHGMGGEPYAVARIEAGPQPASPAPVAAPAPAPAESAGQQVKIVNLEPGRGDATSTIRVLTPGKDNAAEIEARSGVRVVRQGGGGTPGGLIIEVPHGAGVVLAPAPDPRLVTAGKYGPLPRIGPNGLRPMDFYARPMSLAATPGAPRLALVVGGMGLSALATRQAIEKLPPETTFAFAPYGDDLQAQATRARAAGHETVLQLPMEGADAGEAAGPRTLGESLSRDELLDRMSWHLSRFTGYVGVENFLGRRLTAREDTMSAILREVSGLGLLYLDDGGSPFSLAARLGPDLGAPVARADVVIDAVRTPEAITAALARLEAIAREKGRAIGTMSALPASVDLAAKFLQGLETRGVVLAPLTAVARDAPVSAARQSR